MLGTCAVLFLMMGALFYFQELELDAVPAGIYFEDRLNNVLEIYPPRLTQNRERPRIEGIMPCTCFSR